MNDEWDRELFKSFSTVNLMISFDLNRRRWGIPYSKRFTIGTTIHIPESPLFNNLLFRHVGYLETIKRYLDLGT